jgi:pimeloyl-ACP methyl ester carboxylesterase
MAEVIANGVRLHVQRFNEGSRPTVVFVHGLVMDNLSSFYYTLANPVAAAGAEVILYDLRGHGISERTRTGYTVSDTIADLAALLDSLGVEGPVHLVGNSYGGTVALAFAAAHPDRVASLVLIEAHFALEGWGGYMAESLSNIAYGLRQGEENVWRRQYGRKLGRMAGNADDLINRTSLVDDLLAMPPLPAHELRALPCPVLAVYGADSDVLHHAEALDGLLADYTLDVLPGCTHSVLMEATGYLRDRIVAWLPTVVRQ